MRRRRSKVTWLEMKEVDYWERLNGDERAWLTQFLFEYYQADFNFEKPIHPPEMKKDCQVRNNASKRQYHSVGEDKIIESADKARAYQKMGRMKNRYYTPEDWEIEGCRHDDDEEE